MEDFFYRKFEFRRTHDDDACPGEQKCAVSRGRPINNAIRQNTSSSPKGLTIRREWSRNPPRELVSECCSRCPLFPSKPSQDHASQVVAAAANSASRLKRLIDSKLAPILFGPDDLSARRCAAYFGYLNAEHRSDKNRFPKKKPEKTKLGDID